MEARLGSLTDPMKTAEHLGSGGAIAVLVHSGGEWAALAMAVGWGNWIFSSQDAGSRWKIKEIAGASWPTCWWGLRLLPILVWPWVE